MTNKKSDQASLKSLLKQMVISSRPVSWINTAFPFAAGYLATGGAINAYFIIASLYFLISYNFLIYIVNDVFDYESDIRNPRKNSIEGGLLPPSTHKFMLIGVALFNLIPLAYLFILGSSSSNLVLVAIVLAAIFYSAPPLRFKEKPFFDSLTSSFHFVSPLLFALVITEQIDKSWLYLIAFFAWGCASHMFGAVQDIIADRQANISSVATFLGAKNTVRLSFLLYITTFMILIIIGWPAVIVALPVLLYISMVTPYLNLADSEAATANKGWRKFLLINQVTGFIVTIILIYLKFSG